MTGYVGPLLNKHCEGLLISFEDLDFKVIRKGLVVRLAPMRVLQMLVKGGLALYLLGFAIKL